MLGLLLTAKAAWEALKWATKDSSSPAPKTPTPDAPLAATVERNGTDTSLVTDDEQKLCQLGLFFENSEAAQKCGDEAIIRMPVGTVIQRKLIIVRCTHRGQLPAQLQRFVLTDANLRDFVERAELDALLNSLVGDGLLRITRKNRFFATEVGHEWLNRIARAGN